MKEPIKGIKKEGQLFERAQPKQPNAAPKLDVTTLKFGDVLHLPLTEDDDVTPKDGYESRRKKIVILGITGDYAMVGYVLINKDINNTYADPNLQIPIKQSDYPIILPKKDSFIDCGRVRSYDIVNMKEKGEYIGTLTDKDKGILRQEIEQSDHISVHTKRKFGFEDKYEEKKT